MLEHPTLQNKIEFLEHTAEQLIFRSYLRPNNGQTQLHYHSEITESFQIVSGTLTITKNDEDVILNTNDQAIIKPFETHKLYNYSPELVIFDVCVSPPLVMKKGFEIMYGLASDDRIFQNGLPKNPIHLAIALNYLDTYSPDLPFNTQKLGYKLLNFLGKSFRITDWLEQKYCTV